MSGEQPHDSGALARYERSRWIAQRTFIEDWLRELGEGPADRGALRQALMRGTPDPEAAVIQRRADLQRDAAQLDVAIAGQARSAIDPAKTYASTTAFACDEADHAAECAERFVSKIGEAASVAQAAAAVERAQRWLQRLRWELLDTPYTLDAVGLAEAALAARTRAESSVSVAEIQAVARSWAPRIAQLRAHLRPPSA